MSAKNDKNQPILTMAGYDIVLVNSTADNPSARLTKPGFNLDQDVRFLRYTPTDGYQLVMLGRSLTDTLGFSQREANEFIAWIKDNVTKVNGPAPADD